MTPSDDGHRRRRIGTAFGAHFRAVAAYFHRRCETRQDADDATAQVFAEAARVLGVAPALVSARLSKARRPARSPPGGRPRAVPARATTPKEPRHA